MCVYMTERAKLFTQSWTKMKVAYMLFLWIYCCNVQMAHRKKIFLMVILPFEYIFFGEFRGPIVSEEDLVPCSASCLFPLLLNLALRKEPSQE
jgi:hypothetical protein